MSHSLIAALSLLSALSGPAQPACPAPRAMSFDVTGSFHRDIEGFTEGLEMHGGALYESTGALDGGTRLMRMTPQGHVTVLADFGDRFFGEGLTVMDGRLYQLSWRDHQVFVYDLQGRPIRRMDNPREGWGLTHDAHFLIFSDGSDHLFFADPSDFKARYAVTVRRGSEPVDNINELEYVAGRVYANIWQTRTIVRIDPASGCVEAEAHMDGLWDRMTAPQRAYVASDQDFVLNGIAYDPDSGLFYVTGKEWPIVFVGRFQDR